MSENTIQIPQLPQPPQAMSTIPVLPTIPAMPINPTMPTRSRIIMDATINTLDSLPKNALKNLSYVAAAVMEACNYDLDYYNSILSQGKKMSMVKHFSPMQIAKIILKCKEIAMIPLDGSQTANDQDRVMLFRYQTDGEQEGTYQFSEIDFERIITDIEPEFNPMLTT